MLVVFTDLDNCLLDHDTYDFRPALPALERLRAARAAIVLTTSKTRAEVEYWHAQMGLTHPSIVENGGGAVLEGGRMAAFGRPRAEIVAALRAAAAGCGARVRGFSDMSVEEIALRCNMSLERAHLAAARGYSEPFVLETPAQEEELRRALGRAGLELTRGGRFHHALGHAGKQTGVAYLIGLFRQSAPALITIGVGDAPNDEGFLRLVDYAVRLAPGEAGPAGWNRQIQEILDRLGV